mmetsp:Transcript_17972/g.12989  ORF Transcript_17972/g.12989 Transcript_17972/m.12989 type:complete len:96 (+) Transcript_17972:2714-3001(+)
MDDLSFFNSLLKDVFIELRVLRQHPLYLKLFLHSMMKLKDLIEYSFFKNVPLPYAEESLVKNLVVSLGQYVTTNIYACPKILRKPYMKKPITVLS